MAKHRKHAECPRCCPGESWAVFTLVSDWDMDDDGELACTYYWECINCMHRLPYHKQARQGGKGFTKTQRKVAKLLAQTWTVGRSDETAILKHQPETGLAYLAIRCPVLNGHFFSIGPRGKITDLDYQHLTDEAKAEATDCAFYNDTPSNQAMQVNIMEVI